VADSGSIRDSQKSSLYKAERVAFWEHPDSDGSPDFQTVGECQDYVDAVTESDMWQRLADTWRELGLRNPSKTDNPVVVLDGRGRKYAEGKFSDVALVCAEYPNGRHDQDDAEHELERRRRDQADQQPADYRPYHRSHAHRRYGCSQVSSVGERAQTSVSEHPHRDGR
jgi:hypothetical protein